MSPGWYWIFFSPVLMTCSRWAKPVKATLASGPRLRRGPDPFHRVEAGGVGRQLEHLQPRLGGGEGAQLRAEVDIEVVPDQDDVPAGQLVVRGGQQVPVLGPGERLRLALAAAVLVQPVDQPGAVRRAVAGQPGDGDRSGAAAADRMTGVMPRRPQVLERGGLIAWPVSSSKTIQAPRAAAVLLPAARSPSSTPRWRRRPARRRGGRPAGSSSPRRRSRYQIPGIVYCTLNLAAIRSRTRASVHRWSSHPRSRRAGVQHPVQLSQLPSSSRHRAACPFDARPGAPPACQARRHRCTDRSDTRSSAAISVTGTRCSNFSTAASRTCSRRLRPSAVNPPPCAYLIHRAYRRKPRLSPGRHRQLKVVFLGLSRCITAGSSQVM